MVNKWRVILVDDEPLARLGLRNCLTSRHFDFEIVGEAENISQAKQLIQQDDSIDGVFLDIDIETESNRAGLDFGFALNNMLNPPWIIFATGKKEHAIEAINRIKPVGYLLKPFGQVDVDMLLDRIRKDRPVNKRNTLIEIRYKKVGLAADGHVEKTKPTKFLTPDEILYVCSDEATVHLVNGEVLKGVNITLKSWLEHELPYFVQTHKKTIVNLKYVSGFKLDPDKEDNYILQFKNNSTELPIGGIFFGKFKEAIKNSGAM
ncbi:response regulator transcription factor [Methyloglobulus sp.]|uniref:LytR/AlgR family response regulator transcription factor n=1 Tax=Methyloglobulus sp. TaxID=2518622 RepID=UPI0032B75207